MLALAGLPLGLEFVFLDRASDACARGLGRHLVADFSDESALEELARDCDVLTVEFENVPSLTVRTLAQRTPTFPGETSLVAAQDRLAERRALSDAGIPVPPYLGVDSEEQFRAAVEELGLPAVLKTRRLGYDGKGMRVLRTQADVAEAWATLGGVPSMLDTMVRFVREVSVIGVRGRDGQTAFYPLVENYHQDGILRLSVPRPGDPVEDTAVGHTARLMDALGHVGVMAVEFFDDGERLLANELACRVHNSGHWTIEGAVTSQFENHLRAILGLPLGSPAPRGEAAMVNILGAMPKREDLLALPGVHLHDYGKQPRPGRKVGHATVAGVDADTMDSSLKGLLAVVGMEDPRRVPVFQGDEDNAGR